MNVEEGAAVWRDLVDATAVLLVEKDTRAILFPSWHECRDLEDVPRLHDGRAGRSEQISKGEFDEIGEAEVPSDAPYVRGDQVAGDVAAVVDAFDARAHSPLITEFSARG